MPSLASLARDAALATTVLLAAANIAPASAQQQMANAGSPAVTVETAGQVAADMCRRRGDNGPDCVRNERNRMMQQIGQQANNEGACADQLRDFVSRNPSAAERGRSILGGRTVSSFGACNLLGALTRG